ESTRVTLRRDATVRFTQVRSAGPMDEFDLELRLSPRRRRTSRAALAPLTWDIECPAPTEDVCTKFGCTDLDCPTGLTACKPGTCDTCDTCDTCAATCSPTCGPT